MNFEDTVPTAENASRVRPPAMPGTLEPPGEPSLRAPSRRGPPGLHVANLRFDGTGAEYFRIWIVGLLLSLITLGVYSAWAKVRKARWFAQHTELLGDRFDFHGDPLRILAGRALALVLLVLWSVAFDISLWFGIAMALAVCAAGPPLFASAQRFRLGNSSWRGLRFRFDAPVPLVYRVCLPLLVAWCGLSLLAAFQLLEKDWVAVAVLLGYGLAVPWAHARLKQMQHGNAWFGSRRFAFASVSKAMYALYGKAALVLLLAIGAALVLTGSLASGSRAAPTSAVIAASGGVLIVWTVVWPYFAARAQQIVWSRTRWGPTVRFDGTMRFWPLWRLALSQTLLTIATLGLYWPFAAVALARYRIESIRIEADEPLDGVVTPRSIHATGSAGGDASMETFGLDLGW